MERRDKLAEAQRAAQPPAAKVLASANVPATRFAGAALRGSREAYSGILADRAQRLQAGKGGPEKETAKNTKSMRDDMSAMVALLSRQATAYEGAEELGVPA